MFRDHGLARVVARIWSSPRLKRKKSHHKLVPTALYHDIKLLHRLVEDGLLTAGSLCVGFLVVEDGPRVAAAS
jgi:hypothetical protein